MKKLLLIVLLLTLVCSLFLFTACNNATPQGQLGDYFAPYEKYTYTVTDNTNADAPVTGQYTVEIKKFEKDSSVTLSDTVTLTGVAKGHVVTGRLIIADTVIEQACYFDNVSGSAFLVPRASFKRVTKGGAVEFESNISYISGVSYSFKNAEGVLTEGTLAVTSPYYDNNEFLTALRGASTMTSGFSMSYQVPVVAPGEFTTASITASCSSAEDLTVPYRAEAINCYKVVLSRSTVVTGISYTAYYASAELEVNSRKLTRVLMKFIENAVTYELSGVSVVEG